MSVNIDTTSEPYAESESIHQRIFVGIASLVLFGLTAGVYWSACQNGFVAWDDQFYVYEQPKILQGISLNGIFWALTANVAENWHPLTLMSLQLDAQLFGPGASGFHRTAVLLHALNSVLAFVTVFTLTGCRWRSLICGLLFALHPMRVESVAWISGRKDLLSASFFFLTVLGYVRYVRAPSLARYVRMMFFLALGLSAKPMLVTTPCVLLLLDYWPLRRCRGFDFGDRQAWLSVIYEKLPLFGLSIISSILTLVYQQHAMQSVTPGTRLQIAVVSYVTYLSQSFWPVGLSPLYELQKISGLYYCWSIVVLMTLTGIAVWQRKQRPYLLVGWLWFLGMLVPVIGLIYVGHQSHADRYMYLPQLGLYLAIVWSVTSLVDRTKIGRFVATVIAVGFIAGFGYSTTVQIPVWRDTESLWLQAIRVDPANQFALYHLTWLYIVEGKRDKAIQVITNSVPIRNASELEKLVTLATLLADNGEDAAAVVALSKAMEFDHKQAGLFGNRGKAFAALGKWREAADDYRQASKLSPNKVAFQFYLAHALAKSGNQQAAEEIYARVMRQSPQWPQMAASMAWRMSTNPDSSVRFGSSPILLAETANEATGGTHPQVLDVLSAAYAAAGRFQEAATTAELAIQAAEKERQAEFATAVRKRLELYLAQKPYREPPPR